MGIGATIKNVLSSDDKDPQVQTKGESRTYGQTTKEHMGTGHNRVLSDASGRTASSRENVSSSSSSSSDDEGHRRSKLAPGTGVGTDGKGNRGTHTGTGLAAGAAAVGAGAAAAHHHNERDVVTGSRTGDFPDPHTHGHNKLTEAILPGRGAQEDTSQLQHVTHEKVQYHETEEVLREKEHERHVHHVKHHVQPVMHKEERAEEHHDVVHPVTRVNETHASKDEDVRFLNDQVHQHRDTVQHAPKERTVVDLGTNVHEKVHHHVHHVVQPVIEKETHDRHRIHTVIPMHETTHEAPIVHQSEAHAPVTMDQFTKAGGKLSGALHHEHVSGKVMNDGSCRRDVDGPAEGLMEKLHLGGHSSTTGTHTGTGQNYGTTTGAPTQQYGANHNTAATTGHGIGGQTGTGGLKHSLDGQGAYNSQAGVKRV